MKMGTPNHNDDWDDLKTKGAKGKVAKAVAITGSTGQFISDWVGHNDSCDYRAITLTSAAKLSLTINANSNAVKFGIYQLVEKTDKKGNKTYSLKNVLTVTPKLDKKTGKYTLATAGKLLEKGTYYIGVQAANAKKADAGTDYTVSLNKSGSVFYNNSKSLHTDDWDDLKTKGAAGKVAKAVSITASTGQFISDWVGFGDAVDYKGFTLGSTAKLSLTITASDSAKFTICSLVEKTDKKGGKSYSLKKLLSVAPNAKTHTVTTKALGLGPGTYYLCAQSTNAPKGGNASYTVSLNKSGSEFVTRGSSNDNNWDTAPALKGTFSDGELDGSTTGWVGDGDPVDYRTFTTNAANGGGGYYIFGLGLTNNSKTDLNLSVYEIVENKGVKSLKKLKSATATSKSNGVIGTERNLLMLKSDTKYVVGIEPQKLESAKGSNYKLEVAQDAFAHFNMKNNTSKTATKVTTATNDISCTLTNTAGGDNIDWFDISAFAGNSKYFLRLTNAHEMLSVKLTFYDREMKEYKVRVKDLSSKKWSEVSSVYSNPYGFDCYFGGCTDILKYLSVEATGSGRSSYLLTAITR